MLKPEHFSFKCPLQLSDLEKTEGAHFCAKCSKDIYDLSDCSIDEIIELQRRKGSICGFVRTVGLTSLVTLAACSDKETYSQNESGSAEPDQVRQEQQVSHLPGQEVQVTQETQSPKPDEKTDSQDGGEGTAKVDTDKGPKNPEVIKPREVPIEGPVLMGVICPPDQLLPKNPEALDPHREGSPG